VPHAADPDVLALPPLDRAAARPLQAQLYDGLRDAVLTGRLAPGYRLPAVRRLAADLGVSRNTVLWAFDRLVAEGYLKARVGDGTYVARTLPEDLLHARGSTAVLWGTAPPAAILSERGRRLAAAGDLSWALAAERRAFHPGMPDVAAFPRKEWARLLARRARTNAPLLVGYGDPWGFRPLREAIAAYLGAARGVACSPDRVIVVAGSQQGIDLAARLLLDPGDAAAVEDPGYFGAQRALRAAGARLVPVPVDADGIDPGEGDANLAGARLAYVTPSHQFPLGATMGLARRLRLLDWARRTGGWIVEDDYDGEFRYAGRPLPALQGLDAAGRVVYLGTFSKVLFPGLRLGYLVVPPGLADAFAAARASADVASPPLEQAALADFVGEGHFARHVRRMRLRYAERQRLLVRALDRHLGGEVEAREGEAGLHLIAWLPPAADDRAVARRAWSNGVVAPALSPLALGAPPPPGLLLGFAAPAESEIAEGVRRLRQALSEDPR